MILGLRGTGQFSVTGQRPENWREKILELFPNGSAPLTAILSMLKAEKTDSSIFHWYEEKIPAQRLRINLAAGYAAGDTVLIVDATSASDGISGSKMVRTGIILWNERTGEKMYVSDDPASDTQIQCTRGFGTTAAAAILDNDWLTVIGNAQEEGAVVPTAIQYDPDEYSNYCQIFRVPVNLTKSAQVEHFRDGDAYKNAKRRALRDISIQREMAYLFGELKSSTGPKGMPLKTTRGLLTHIETYASANVIDVGGALSEQAFDGYMEQVSRYGSGNKFGLCGSGALMVLSSLAKGGNIQVQSVATSESYGMSLTKYQTTHGDLILKSHPLFNMHPVLRYNMVILDTAHIKERILIGRDLNFLKDRHNPGDDMVTDEYLIESGIETNFADAHMYLKNITSFAP